MPRPLKEALGPNAVDAIDGVAIAVLFIATAAAVFATIIAAAFYAPWTLWVAAAAAFVLALAWAAYRLFGP